jgi:hypothetical protein
LAGRDDPLAGSLAGTAAEVRSADSRRGPLLCHPRYAADVPVVKEMLERLDGTLDLAEPFARIRDAISEARKMGVTSRN